MDPKNVEKINVFILAGQSNMAGRGGVFDGVWDEYIPVECRSNKRILRLNGDSELEEAKEPLHEGIDDVKKTCGIGPGMAFANAILKKDPNFGVIILVPCAYGGTSITDWSIPNSKVRSRLISRANQTLKYGGKIRAILWYQGETETRNEAAAKKFRSQYDKFLHRLYQELKYPKAPFIQVALASGQGVKNWIHSVRASQMAMKNVTTVDAFGLQLGADGMHLTTAAQVQLGKMMAHAFFNTTT
ncbi:putative carbohydrate esterase [Forsythia ovata]|uniref:Carbohydrate esterase n=1 Tax=Forsythia ovata TaxID=205694 RepID=A0ABD1P549_9LAMI